LSKPSLEMKLRMKSFGLAKLFKTSVCGVCKGKDPRASPHDRSCLEVGAKNTKCRWSSSGVLTAACAPRD